MRDNIRDAYAISAYETYKALECTGTYKDRDSAAVTLYLWAGVATKSIVEVLKTDSESDSRRFHIPIQAGFTADNVHISNVITFEGHSYHVVSAVNNDGLGAIFTFDAVCTHPNRVGAE